MASLIVLVFILIGMPVAFSFLAGSMFYFLMSGASMGSVATDAFFSLDKYALLAIPLFMISGTLMEVSGIAERLIDFSRALLKKFKGGLGAIIPVSSMFFGALSGSGTATVAALSTILVPRLSQLGWDKRYLAAMLAASGPLGYMIPPNMNAILFGVVGNASIAALFLATVIPGIMWGLLYVLINRLVYHKWYTPVEGNMALAQISATTEPEFTSPLVEQKTIGYFQDLYKTFVAAIPAFIMPLIIFGGIYGGAFTATEAGAVACVYAIIAGKFIFKKVNLRNGVQSFIDTGISLGSIMIILPMVMIFTKILVINGIPQAIAQGVQTISSNPNVIILFIVLVLFIAGFFLDAGVLIFVLTPLLLPTANAIGMDTIQLGTILFVAIGVGTITPPMAMNLFITSKASGVPMQDMMRPLLPFLIGAIFILLLVAYVPALSLWLPNLVLR